MKRRLRKNLWPAEFRGFEFEVGATFVAGLDHWQREAVFDRVADRIIFHWRLVFGGSASPDGMALGFCGPRARPTHEERDAFAAWLVAQPELEQV